MCDSEENNDEKGCGDDQRMTDEENDEMMGDRDVPQYPRTPGKRQRRTSDVIDSMGESPASTTSYSYSPYPSTPSSSTSFVTPQRPMTHTYWQPTVSPDLGYGSPQLDGQATYTPEWMYSQPVPSQDDSQPSTDQQLGSQRDTSIACLPSSMFTLSGELSGRLSAPEETDSLLVSVSGRVTVHRDSDRYNMSHKNRGKCVVFNHENFDIGFAPRQGTTYDARRIEETFQKLGFDVEVCDDYEHSAITDKIKDLSEQDHTDNDCLCIFVLTHGMVNDFICAKDVAYRSEVIWKPFTADKCTSLAGKPKLFFFQACRGENMDSGVSVYRAGIPATETDSSCDTKSYKIPTHADFLFAHSTPSGFYSWRDIYTGTWYIQSLCDILNEYAETTDLAKMLTMTARKVAIEYASMHMFDPALHDQKQVPSVTSMLIRDLYFTPKNE